MKPYKQLNIEERYMIGMMRVMHFSLREIARVLERSPSTISRELRRNRYPTDGKYRAMHAASMANGRRRRARWGSHFSSKQWRMVEKLLREDLSPDQVSGVLRRKRKLSISHETIYKHVWQDKRDGGTLWSHLRGAGKQRRKGYGRYDSRGRLAGKRPIGDRPTSAEKRSRIGHWEIDTVMGSGRACILTIVDRKTGYTAIGQLDARTIAATNSRLSRILQRQPQRFRTITADNGCEFHGYKDIEENHDLTFYFAAPHHSWERGTNENTNGLIRQYLPKGTSMDTLTQARCNAIASKLNNRPRKRLGYKTPAELFLN